MCVFFTPALRSRVDSKTLTRNTRLIAEALTRVIYNLTEKVSPCPAPTPPPAPAPPGDPTQGTSPLSPQGTPPDMPVFTEQMVTAGQGGGAGQAGLGAGGAHHVGVP